MVRLTKEERDKFADWLEQEAKDSFETAKLLGTLSGHDVMIGRKKTKLSHNSSSPVSYATPTRAKMVDNNLIETVMAGYWSRIKELEAENTLLRGLIQLNADWKCTYSFKDLKSIFECPLGFLGCNCADDLMFALQEAEVRRERREG